TLAAEQPLRTFADRGQLTALADLGDPFDALFDAATQSGGEPAGLRIKQLPRLVSETLDLGAAAQPVHQGVPAASPLFRCHDGISFCRHTSRWLSCRGALPGPSARKLLALIL